MFPVYNIKVIDEPGPKFGSIEYVLKKPIVDEKYYENLNYDDEVNRLLDEVKEEFLGDISENYDVSKDISEVSNDESESDDSSENTSEISRDESESDDLSENTSEISRDKSKNYDFLDDTHQAEFIPDWYRDMLQNKMKEAKSRLQILSKQVCANSPSTATHIKRIEEDHGTAFCKMDYPRHPPMYKPWTSNWELCYEKTCKERDSNHKHSISCGGNVVVDFVTKVRLDDHNTSEQNFPSHVIRVAELFQRFAEILNKKIAKSKCQDKSECKENVETIDDDWWITMRMILISNHLNELLIVVRQYDMNHLASDLKSYFKEAIKKNPKIVSVLAFDPSKRNVRNRGKMRNLVKLRNYSSNNLHIAGAVELKDEIGPLSIRHDLANHRVFFDSVETTQLYKVIHNYMCLTKETTLLDINCYLGVLSLLMSYKCEKVIGLNKGTRAKWLNEEAEKLKKANNIDNVSFLQYALWGDVNSDIFTTCAPLIEQCITVAILKLRCEVKCGTKATLRDEMKALRNLPSIWRVIIYGPFTEQFHESIELLTSEDDSMGERYLPMQGCILDKSPTVVNDFDIVILFERKSLIKTKIELFAPGPTVNVAVDTDMCDHDSFGFSPPPPSESFQDDEPEEPANDQSSPSQMEKSELRFDRPPPPLEILPPIPHQALSVNVQVQLNYPPLAFQRPHPFHPNPSGPVRQHYQNVYPPPLLQPRFASPNFYPGSYPPAIFQGPYPPNDFQRCLYPENYYNPPYLPDSYPVVSNESFHYDYQTLLQPPPPPPVRYLSPPPLPPLPPLEKIDLPGENSSGSSSSTIVTDEPMELCEEEKVDEMVNEAENVISSVVIKSEPIDTSYSVDVSEANCYLPTKSVENKLLQVCEEKAGGIVNTAENVIASISIKSESVDPSYSADFLEANCQSPTTTVKAEPLQDEEKNETNVEQCRTTVQSESLQDEEKEESEVLVKAELLLNQDKKQSDIADSGTSSSVTIKWKPTDRSSSINFSDTSCQNIALPTTTESEPTAFSPITSPDCETVDMQISPSQPDFHSMKTPIHDSRALSDITPVTISKNVSVDGSEFPVQTNQSFFSKIKPINVDREPGEISDSDEENEAIGEEKNKQQTITVPRRQVSTIPIVSRKLVRPPRPYPGKYSKPSSSLDRPHRRRSPTPKRFRRSPTPETRRRRRSPVSDRRRERSRRSPLRRTHDRAKSPRDRRKRRSRSRSPRRR